VELTEPKQSPPGKPGGILSVSKNHPAQQCPSLLLEEKVSPVHTLVTDVVENVTISPGVWYKTQHFAAHHISQKSVLKCRFLPASPRGEAFFPILYFFDSLTPPVAEATGGAALGEYKEYYGILLGNVSVGVGAGDPGITTSVVKPLCADRVLVGCVRA